MLEPAEMRRKQDPVDGNDRKILRVYRLQKLTNETVRNKLEQEETIIDNPEKKTYMVRSHGKDGR